MLVINCSEPRSDGDRLRVQLIILFQLTDPVVGKICCALNLFFFFKLFDCHSPFSQILDYDNQPQQGQRNCLNKNAVQTKHKFNLKTVDTTLLS